MNCSRCQDKDIITFTRDKIRYHKDKGSEYICDDYTPEHRGGDITEAERKILFRIIDVAAAIRERHCVELYTALDWAKEVIHSSDNSMMQTDDYLVHQALSRNHHFCVSFCQD